MSFKVSEHVTEKSCRVCKDCTHMHLNNSNIMEINLKKKNDNENIAGARNKRKTIANEILDVKRKKEIDQKEEIKIELGDLNEDVLITIFKNVSSPGLVNTSKTCWFFHRLCYNERLWEHRCKVDFYLQTKWLKFTYLYLYEMFFKAKVLCSFKFNLQSVLPYKRIKSIMVWNLINRVPPCLDVWWFSEKEACITWKVTEKEIIEMYSDKIVTRNEKHSYSWYGMNKLSIIKHGGVVPFQEHVLKRCLRNRKVLEKQYKLTICEYGGATNRKLVANKLGELYC